jgi:hypothetical protein
MSRKLRLGRKQENHPIAAITATVLGSAAMLGVAYLAVRALPELVRYVRIRRM